jgi:transcriptional regulator with XRE-family HTH domain
MDVERQVAQNIRRIRLEKRISQEALAHEAEITRSHMGAIERGERSPTVRMLIKIAGALDTTAIELFSDGTFPTPPNLPRGRRKK